MIKQLKRYGSNLVVLFTAEEERTYGLVVGDKIEIPDMIVQVKNKKRKNARVSKSKLS